MSGSSWNRPETVLSLAAVVIAVCALALSIYEGRTAREVTRVQHLPVVWTNHYYDDEGSGIRMFNTGLGPASVRWVRLFADEKPVSGWAEMLKALDSPPATYTFSNPPPILVANAKHVLFWASPGPLDDWFRTNQARIALDGCFCSLFRECWYIPLQGAVPDTEDFRGPGPVKSCAPPPDVLYGGYFDGRPY